MYKKFLIGIAILLFLINTAVANESQSEDVELNYSNSTLTNYPDLTKSESDSFNSSSEWNYSPIII